MSSQTDLMKYEYIEMVKQNRENEHLVFLLADPMHNDKYI
jgi:hypothetical protein